MSTPKSIQSLRYRKFPGDSYMTSLFLQAYDDFMIAPHETIEGIARYRASTTHMTWQDRGPGPVIAKASKDLQTFIGNIPQDKPTPLLALSKRGLVSVVEFRRQGNQLRLLSVKPLTVSEKMQSRGRKIPKRRQKR